jgi:hypothetical protein
MEELKKELEKLSKAYVDTPENEEKILIPFVKRLLELPMKERRKLLPVIRDLQWIKSKFAGFSSETTCSAARAHFLSAVQFVCANKREMDMAYHVKFDMLCKLLPLYYPTWLTDFINDDKTWFNFDLNYEQLMQLMDMGYLKEIAPSRIAHVLPWITRIRNKEPKGNDTFNSELLLKRDITLKEHIWTIFEYESSTGYQDDCAKEAYKKGVTARDESISAALYRFSLDGHLDRERLLKATLATFHRSFKKDMAGWFAGFFETLQPTTGELLSLQEEMMQIFTSSYTKPVNVMLQQLKNIASEEGFRYQEFIERATTLFFSSPKNSLLTIYALFEKIVAQHPEMKEPCCIILCQLFLKKDESLQKKECCQLCFYIDDEKEQKVMPFLPNLSLSRWHPLFADVNVAGISKATGLSVFADYYGIGMTEIMACGNGGNDIPMLKAAGIGVAMGNASEIVKASANFVTGTVENDGLCKALKHFGII